MDTKTVATVGVPHPGLLAWLSASRIDYEIHEHAVTQTARQTARAEGVDPRTFAKVVGVRTADGQNVLLVLDATDRVDLTKARKALGLGSVRLLTEAELTALAPECEAGAIPAVGALFGLRTYADHAIAQDAAISFNAGTHHTSVRVDREAWEHAAGVVYCDLAEQTELTPAWAR